jgi:hypothetical protein
MNVNFRNRPASLRKVVLGLQSVVMINEKSWRTIDEVIKIKSHCFIEGVAFDPGKRTLGLPDFSWPYPTGALALVSAYGMFYLWAPCAFALCIFQLQMGRG